jgi:uncharacterized membrane protein
MKKIYDTINMALLLLIGITVFTGYPKLPGRIPTHFDLAGNPDRWSGRSAFIVLAAVAWGMTILFYALARYLPRMTRNPRYLNIPHKELFLKLPEEKQMVYWALLTEFLAGLMAGLNLLWFLVIRGTLRIATGETRLLPFKEILPAFILVGVILIIYLKRLFTLPGKLIRGEG